MSKRVKVRRGFISPPAKEEPPVTAKTPGRYTGVDFSAAIADARINTVVGMDIASGPDMVRIVSLLMDGVTAELYQHLGRAFVENPAVRRTLHL